MIRRIGDFGLKRVAYVSVIAIACLGGNSWWTYNSITHLVEESEWVERTADIQYQLAKLETDIVNAETGERGYVLAGVTSYLEPYYAGIRYAGQRLSMLDGLLAYDADLRAKAAELHAAVDAKFEEMDAILVLMTSRGQVAARQRIASGAGRTLMNDLRSKIGAVQSAVDADLADQKMAVALARNSALTSLFVFIAGTLLLVGLLYTTARRELARRAQDGAEIKQYAASLNASMAELRTERNEIRELNEAAGYMQSCDSVPELGRLLAPILERMFVGYTGEIFLHAPSRNRLDGIVAFGGATGARSILPTDCWALRRGQEHLLHAGNGAPECSHHHAEAPGQASLCVPLVAHGDTIGLLTLTANGSEQTGSTTQDATEKAERTLRLAQMVGAQLGLTLANLKLQDSLRQQAITDPLTQAFNRRYLDATGDKILAHAGRFGQPLAVVMLDVDHFKNYNDVHGHVAGDHALTAVAQFMQAHIREADWLFRYGGEEFLIILQGSNADDAATKLNAMREALAVLQFSMDDVVLPSVTISMGCAIYPSQARSLSELIQLADDALYEAKASGRNRLCLASPSDQASAVA